jgi:membrane fusion protein (multidrug efflux system)
MAEGDPRIDADTAVATPGPIAPRPKPGRLRLWAIMASVPLLLIGGAVWYYWANDHYVSTDNAYIQQDKVSISAEVSGRIVEVGVHENQPVHRGDLLFRIDPEPYRIASAQADAMIAAAQVKVVGMQTDLSTKGADIAAARAALTLAQENYSREAQLMKRGFTTRARMDAATEALAAARGALANAEGAQAKARAALATSPVAPGVGPAVLAGPVQRRNAA